MGSIRGTRTAAGELADDLVEREEAEHIGDNLPTSGIDPSDSAGRT